MNIYLTAFFLYNLFNQIVLLIFYRHKQVYESSTNSYLFLVVCYSFLMQLYFFNYLSCCVKKTIYL